MSPSDSASESEYRVANPMALLNRQSSVTNAIRRISLKVMADTYHGDGFVLQQELGTLQMHFDRLLAVHEIQTHIALWADMEVRYNEAMAKLKRMQAAMVKKEDDGTIPSHTTGTVDIKLDLLTVPKFDGTLQNWLAFKDAFDTLVHSQGFPDAYKLGKLREAVQGDAVALVGGMYTGGYEAVWEALMARYDSPKQLVDIHVSRFIGLRPQSVETATVLLSIVDTVRESFRALTVMKLPVDQWDALAVPIITSKFPQATQQAWGMSQELLTFVEKRANSLAADVLLWPTVNSPI